MAAVLVSSLAFVALGGCAGRIAHTAPPADHPASPQAALPAPASAPAPLAMDEFDAPIAPGGAASPPVPPAATHHGHAQPTGVSYTCPMHPDVVADQPGSCPECGMKLIPGAKR